jgi:hypothetical protein
MSDQVSRTPTPPNLPPPTGETAPPAPKPKRRAWVWLVVLVVFGLVFWWVLTRTNAPAAAPTGRAALGGTVTATTAKASKGDIGVYLTAIGTVTPVYTDSIVSQVTGQVVAVHYREGQLLHKGDPLVDIDPRPYEATLKQAEGALERDTHLLEQAQMDLERYQAAWARNAIAKQQVDDQDKLVLQDLSPSRTFILRPVATSLLMVAILLAGIVAYKQLPVSALPEVDYPTIQVITFYPGRQPGCDGSSVTAPLERQFGQVPGLQQMTSTSSDGSSVITLQFNLSLNIDVAEQEVQQSINASGTYLPPIFPRRRSTARPIRPTRRF